MAISKTVRRGDSLWALANRYLGSGARYPQIVDYHNQEAPRHGLRHIDEPNLIFVGETILIPPPPKSPKPGNSPKAKGTKTGGGQPATPVSAKVTFVIGRDTPPIVYTSFSGDYTIKTEMSGGIDIEIASPDRYRHSLELFFSKNTVEARQKLHDAYDPAIVALTAKPEMVFESGKVKIEAPIATEANLGPYTIEVHGTPMQMSGFLKPPSISGTLEMGRRRYKYTADIELRADVIRHQRPKGSPEPVKVTEPVQKVERQENPGIGWGQIGKDVGNFTVKVTIATGLALACIIKLPEWITAQMARISIPLIYEIDPRNSTYIVYYQKHEA